MSASFALIALALALGQADGGVSAKQGYRAAEPALRLSMELADGGVVALPALPDGGVVAVVLTPSHAVNLANERQQKDYELAQLKTTHPTTWIVVVGQVLSAALNAVPLVVALTRSP